MKKLPYILECSIWLLGVSGWFVCFWTLFLCFLASVFCFWTVARSFYMVAYWSVILVFCSVQINGIFHFFYCLQRAEPLHLRRHSHMFNTLLFWGLFRSVMLSMSNNNRYMIALSNGTNYWMNQSRKDERDRISLLSSSQTHKLWDRVWTSCCHDPDDKQEEQRYFWSLFSPINI